jgi:LEA14-like dessication related protein
MPLLFVLASCDKVDLPKSVDGWMPQVAFDRVDIDDVDLQGAKAVFVLKVTNPHPVGLQLPGVNWDLDVAGSDLANGAKDTPVAVDADGTSKVRLPVQLAWRDVLAVAQGARGQDVVPFALRGDVLVDTPLGPLRAPFDHAGDLPVLHAPKVSLQALRLESLQLAKGTATLALDLGLDSDGASPLGLDALDYTVKLGGTAVADGTTSWTPKAGQSTLTLPLTISLGSLGQSVVAALSDKGDVKVGLVGDATLATPLGAVPMVIDQSTTLKVR